MEKNPFEELFASASMVDEKFAHAKERTQDTPLAAALVAAMGLARDWSLKSMDPTATIPYGEACDALLGVIDDALRTKMN